LQVFGTTAIDSTVPYDKYSSKIKFCFSLAWINARCPPKPLDHSPSSTRQGKGNMMKGSRVEIRTGRDHSAITSRTKLTELGQTKEFNSSPTKSQ